MIEKILMTLLELLITNSDKISASIAIILVVMLLVHLINRIGDRAEKASAREDDFQSRLLDLHTKTIDNNDRLIENNEQMTLMLRQHEESARERYEQQEKRDRERTEFTRKQTEAMDRIIKYLGILDETKSQVENIESTVVRTQGNVNDMQTDIPALINRRSREQMKRLDEVYTKVDTGLGLLQSAMEKLHKQVVDISVVQESQVADGEQREALQDSINAVADVMEITNTLVNNLHTLVQELKPVTNNIESNEEQDNETTNTSDSDTTGHHPDDHPPNPGGTGQRPVPGGADNN